MTTIEFNTKKERRIVDIIPLTFEQFKELIEKYKPSEIWCTEWSSEKPFITVSQYTDTGLTASCEGFGNKSSEQYTFEEFFRVHKNGLTSFSIKVRDEHDIWEDQREAMFDAWKSKQKEA